jgi:hypothetical protein
MKCDLCGKEAEELEQRIDYPAVNGRAPMACKGCTTDHTEECNMVGCPHDKRRFTLDGEPVDAATFIHENGFAMPDVEQINSLGVGETITYGGGAAATFVLKRVA